MPNHDTLNRIYARLDDAARDIASAKSAAMHESLDPEAGRVVLEVLTDLADRLIDAHVHIRRVDRALTEEVSA